VTKYKYFPFSQHSIKWTAFI